jgi:hypothetical protein
MLCQHLTILGNLDVVRRLAIGSLFEVNFGHGGVLVMWDPAGGPAG